MNRHRLKIIVPIVVLGLAGAAAVIYLSDGGRLRQQIEAQLSPARNANTGALMASGFIEADTVDLSPELGGRVTALAFAEGDEVSSGDVLMRLDAAILEAQRDIAQAQLDITIAQRDLLKVLPREEVIRQAQAQVALAQASVDAAEVAVGDAAAIANDPQEVQLQVVDAQVQLAVALQQLDASQVQFTAAGRSSEMYYQALGKLPDAIEMAGRYGLPEPWIPLDMTLAPKRYEQAGINLHAAQDSVAGAQSLLAEVQAFADNPAALRARVADAQAQLQGSRAAMERTQAELEALKVGPTNEDLEVAEARIEEARAAVEAIDARIERMHLSAPIDGLILDQSVHVGELATPGLPVITIASLDTVELTVYLPEDRLNHVRLGQEVEVEVDSFPGETFEGVVTLINDEAEFTPRGVQTREERVNLVFAITISLDNPDHALKPGMPADASFD